MCLLSLRHLSAFIIECLNIPLTPIGAVTLSNTLDNLNGISSGIFRLSAYPKEYPKSIEITSPDQKLNRKFSR